MKSRRLGIACGEKAQSVHASASIADATVREERSFREEAKLNNRSHYETPKTIVHGYMLYTHDP